MMFAFGDDPLGSKIMEAFQRPNSWRTVRGVAKDTGLPLETVKAFLEEHAEVFLVSPISPGGTTTLYAPKERHNPKDQHSDRILA